MPRDNMPTGARECPACHNVTMRDVCKCGVVFNATASGRSLPVADCWKCAQAKVGGTPCDLHPASIAPPVVERARAKPRTPKLNDTEKRWWREIPATHFPAHKVIPHGLLLPLTDGGVYTCDFYLLTLATIGTVIEIKGGYKGPGFEQGIERYRRARFEWEGYVKFELWDGENKEKWEVER